MNIQELLGDNIIRNLKETYVIDGVIRTKALMVKSVFNKFPEFGKIFKNNFDESEFREVLYCIFNDISEIPKCKNPKCKKHTNLRNFVKGFQECCCKECVAEYQHLSETHRENCRKGSLLRFSNVSKVDAYTSELNCDYSIVNYYIFRNYCKHGDIKLTKSVANKIHEYNHGTYCIECNNDIFNNYIPTDIDIITFQQIFPDFYKKYSHAMKYKWWLTYYPKYFKIIVSYFEKYVEAFDKDTTIYAEMYYQFLHDMKGRPHCCMCGNIVEFQVSANEYRKFCDEHLYGFNKSSQELDLGEFIDTLGVPVIKNTQDIIQGELDFYFPEHRLAIEYNGCWWHSDKFKTTDYHYSKWLQCKDKGIQLIFIWEDDLLYHQNKVYSLIKSKLGLYAFHIYARKCVIKEVPYLEAKAFINAYHMQGYSIDKIRLGLYYGNELVSIMTFGKSRFKSDDMEIIRYCCKADYQIIGGASKLFEHFKRNYEYTNIVSYAECDISNGKLYEKLGMTYVHRTDNWKWMYKGIRYNRLHKIRNEHKNELVKCYSAGIMKYILEKEP